MKLDYCLATYTKVYLECIKVLNVKLETIKLLEENIDSTLFGTGLGPQARETKAKINK